MTKCDFNKFTVSVMDVFLELAFRLLSKTFKDILSPPSKMLLRAMIFAPYFQNLVGVPDINYDFVTPLRHCFYDWNWFCFSKSLRIFYWLSNSSVQTTDQLLKHTRFKMLTRRMNVPPTENVSGKSCTFMQINRIKEDFKICVSLASIFAN